MRTLIGDALPTLAPEAWEALHHFVEEHRERNAATGRVVVERWSRRDIEHLEELEFALDQAIRERWNRGEITVRGIMAVIDENGSFSAHGKPDLEERVLPPGLAPYCRVEVQMPARNEIHFADWTAIGVTVEVTGQGDAAAAPETAFVPDRLPPPPVRLLRSKPRQRPVLKLIEEAVRKINDPELHRRKDRVKKIADKIKETNPDPGNIRTSVDRFFEQQQQNRADEA